jgi:hypothetical protein
MAGESFNRRPSTIDCITIIMVTSWSVKEV